MRLSPVELVHEAYQAAREYAERKPPIPSDREGMRVYERFRDACIRAQLNHRDVLAEVRKEMYYERKSSRPT